MPDVFTKAKRSEVMSRIRSRGNKATEIALAKLFRRHNHRLAAESKTVWQAGLCFSKTQARGVCGWLFLGRLSNAHHTAEKQSCLLEK
jgi:hypothetical protein